MHRPITATSSHLTITVAPAVETVLYTGELSSWGRFLNVVKEVKMGEK